MLSFFPLDVLDEIWDLIESTSEGFLTYSCKKLVKIELATCDVTCKQQLNKIKGAEHNVRDSFPSNRSLISVWSLIHASNEIDMKEHK